MSIIHKKSITESLGQLVDWIGREKAESTSFHCPKEQAEFNLRRELERAERDHQWPVG